MKYRRFLLWVHELLAPRRYLEIGVRSGDSLALAGCPAVGIDPDFAITVELHNQIHLYRTTSDEYFSRPDPLAPTGGQPFDLTFIDGLHLLEYAFRDFINAERHSSDRSVIIFDDVLPRNADEAARECHTHEWTGDVYSMVAILARYRPDLLVLPVSTLPTGLLMIVGTDPASTVLSDNYAAIMAEYRRPDPQPVPADILDRAAVLPPRRVVDSAIWPHLRQRAGQESQEWRRALVEIVDREFGPAFTPGRTG